jgi:tight adherence protein B
VSRRRFDPVLRLEQQMWQAGMYQGAQQALLLMAALAVAGAVLGILISGDKLIAFGAAMTLGIAPFLYIRLKRSRRLKAFMLQLPFALDLLKPTLEAGHIRQRLGHRHPQAGLFDHGAELAADRIDEFLFDHLHPTLQRMLRRVPVDDLRLLVVAVKVQTEVGSSLAQIIARLSDIVRTRQRLFSQIRALTAQSRMSGMVVGVLPLVVLAMFSIVQPTYTQMLFFDPTGKLILKVAMGLDLGAFLLIRRILKVRF